MRALEEAVAQMEVELLGALRAAEAGDRAALEAFLVAAHLSLLEIRDALLLQGLLEEEKEEGDGEGAA